MCCSHDVVWPFDEVRLLADHCTVRSLLQPFRRLLLQSLIMMDRSRLQQSSHGTDLFNLLPVEILVQILASLPFDTRSVLCRRAPFLPSE